MFSIYNVESNVAYACEDRNGSKHTTRVLHEMDFEQLSTKYQVKLNIDINIIVASNICHPCKVPWIRGETNLASIINAFNKRFMEGQSPLVFDFLSLCEGEVMVTNTCDEDAYIFLYAYDLVAMVPAGGTTMVKVNALLNFGAPKMFAWRDHPYVVVGDVPILHLKATLQRKNGGGSYVREETLALRSGFFRDEDEFVDHINKCIMMRGERNGFIYHATMEYGVITLHATHRQPNGSFVEVTSLYPFAGISGMKKITFPLRTKGKVELDIPCGHVFDMNIQNRRMY